MDSTTQILTIIIFFLTLVVTIIVTQFVRRRRSLYILRDIAAFQRLPSMIGEAIESNRPVHVSLGNASLGGENTLVALANAEFMYQVARRAVIGTAAPIFTVGDSSALPLAQDTLRRAYASRGIVSSAPYSSARWYPGGHALALAAALTATVVDDKVGANVLGGSFGTELALVGYAAARRNQSIIATSNLLEGQAVAWVMSDEALIGEEVFTAGAYLGDSSSQVAGVVTQDTLRLLLILLILIPTIITLGDTFLNGRFGAALSRLLGGG